MKFKLFFLSLLFIFLHNGITYAQETEQEVHEDKSHELKDQEEHESHEEGPHKKHAISIVISHTHIKSGVKNNTGDNWIALPSFGINYNYNFNEKWAIGLHNDMIIEEFIVEDKNSDSGQLRNEEVEIPGIERGRPIASAIMITYKAHEHVALMAGGGMEFSEHENFGLIRLGVEFPFHIPNDWELLGVLAYDFNIDAYNSFTFGIGVAKMF